MFVLLTINSANNAVLIASRLLPSDPSATGDEWRKFSERNISIVNQNVAGKPLCRWQGSRGVTRGAEMKSQELAPLYDQQQVYHRSRRNQRGALKQWTEKSIWTFVCAMELGLVSESVPNCNNVNVSSTKWPSTVRKVNNSFMVAAVSAAPTTSTNQPSPFLSLGESSSKTQKKKMQISNRQIVKTQVRKTQVSNARVSKTQEIALSQKDSKSNEIQIDHHLDSMTIANHLESQKEIKEEVNSEFASGTVGVDDLEIDHDYVEKEALLNLSGQSDFVPEDDSVNTTDQTLTESYTEHSTSQNSPETNMKKTSRPRRSGSVIKTDSDYEYEPAKRKKRAAKAKKKWTKPKIKTEVDDRSTTDISYGSYEGSNKAKKNRLKLKAGAKKNKADAGSSEEENEELHRRRMEIRRSLEKAREESRQNEWPPKRKGYDAEAEKIHKCEALRVKLLGKPEDECSESKVTTRRSMKNKDPSIIGKLVWGNCSGWWPALIVDADHVGMLPEAGKLWVYWIAEARISLLNEKTQVEPFSSHLKARLSQSSNASRLRAIDATMQMLRGRLDCALTKPYYTWLETNLFGMFEMLDEVRFYPYPKQMQERIQQLKRKNSKAVEKFLEDKKRTEENQGKKAKETEKKESSQTQSQVQKEEEDPARLPISEQNPGVIAWAKIIGHNWWPAMVVDYRDCCMREPTFGCQWIIWYGDYQLSEVHHQFFLRFDRGMERMREYTYSTRIRKPNFAIGVLQAAKDFGSRLGLNTEEWTLDDAFTHIPKVEQNQTLVDSAKPTTSYVKIYDKYTPHIVQKLNECKKEPKINFARANEIIDSDDLQSVISGNEPFDSLCLKCMKLVVGEKESHPFFEGSLCKYCAGDFKPFMFVFGNDGKCFYCTVCSATGTVLICDKEDCPRVYCAACVKYLLCPATYREVLQEDPWYCFLCKSDAKTPLDPTSILKPRIDWREKIIDVFRTNSKAHRLEPDGNERRKIRVLSLFDGLATGLLVLEKLGLAVEVYYASEIDADSLMVSTAHFGNRIQHLGDVRKITKEKLEEIGPIDLLIGGSPCNDLSLANPGRRGLNDPKGTGILFFEYVRILKLMKKINKKRQLFWLYENVASMPTKFRLEINKYLRQEPDTIDSADFSPQHRLRLYWHNLPVKPHSFSFQPPQDVQDILTPHCQRYALVKKIRTVTTRVNSLRQGVQHLKPIMMQDKSDTIWITELEEIFGFPRHYTDVKNLSATKRQKLIGKSWSVQTLTAILGSLCPFFECNTNNDNTTKLETQV